MVTFNEQRYVDLGQVYYVGDCLSSDTKPTGGNIMNGSKLLEMDTSTLYIYDKASQEWRAWGKNV